MEAQGQAEPGGFGDAYRVWNAAVATALFTEANRDKPVYLDIEESAIAQMADCCGAEGIPRDALLSAVQGVLNQPQGSHNMFFWPKSWTASWLADGRRDEPPFLALLASFSLAAEDMRSDGGFASHNYYARLAHVLGVAADDETALAHLRRDFAEESHRFWDALNTWLLDQEGRFGLPTAYAFDRRVHVSIPISQGLVREADRAHLPELFAAYRLQPRQRISIPDMVEILERAVPDSQMSKSFQAMWAKAEARERIAGVVCVELENWDGAGRPKNQSEERKAKIRLVAKVRTHLSPRIDFELIVDPAVGVPLVDFRLDGDYGAAAAAAIKAPEGALTAHAGPDGDIVVLGHPGDVSIPDLLFSWLTVESKQPPCVLTREAQSLVVLEFDQRYRWFSEVSRIQLGVESLVLAYGPVKMAVEAVLTARAAPGFKKLTSADLGGLPEGWTAFLGVHLMDVPREEDHPFVGRDDFAPLMPLSWTQVAFDDGFSLPGYATWHARRPPEVMVSSYLADEVRAVLRNERVLGARTVAPDVELGDFHCAGVVRLSPDDVSSGDYSVVLQSLAKGKPDKVLMRAPVRIRTADDALWVRTGARDTLTHGMPLDGWATLSAAPADGAAPAGVEGALVSGAPPEAAPSGTDAPVPARLPALEVPREEADEEGPYASTDAASEMPEDSCLVTGVHHWVFEDAVPGRAWNLPWQATCKFTGHVQWFKPKKKKPISCESRPQALAPVLTAARAVRRPLDSEVPADLDLLLDALSYAGSGSWDSFVRLASQMDDQPWFATDTARLLASLGHIDVALDPQTLRAVRWSVATPTLVRTARGDYVLCGARPRGLVARLRDDVQEMGGRLEEVAGSGGITVYRVEELDDETAELVCDEAGSDHDGWPLRYAGAAHARLLAALPRLEEVLSALVTVPVPSGADLEWFDLPSGSWVAADDTVRAGVYRHKVRPLRYLLRLRSNDDPWHLLAVDNALGKYLAAWDAGHALLAYEADEERLVCRLGAPLPGLYGRAAVLCSGEPPTPCSDSTIVYPHVPAAAAQGLWRLLAPGDGRDRP